MAKEYIDREAAKVVLAQNYEYSAINLLCCVHAADVVEIPKSGIGDLSDGYHSFNELYHHRAILFSVICNSNPDKAWKSKLHDTGDMYDGMFIVGIETPQGQATYHYDINPYWDMFKVKELEKAPKWDGHTPKDAIERISVLKSDVAEVRHGRWHIMPEDPNDESECPTEEGWYRIITTDGEEMTDYYFNKPTLTGSGVVYWRNCKNGIRAWAKMDGKDDSK